MNIAQVADFVTNHPWLVGIFLFALVALVVMEIRNRSRLAIDPSKLIAYINRDHAVIWDIRPKKDFDQGHITAAKHVASDTLNDKITKAITKSMAKNQKTTRPIILVCDNGMRSAGHLKKVSKAHDSIFYLQGGMAEWQNQKLPLVRS